MFETLNKTHCLKYDVSAVFIPELKEVHISSDRRKIYKTRSQPSNNSQTNGDVMWNFFSNCLENGHVVYKDAYEIEQSQIAINLQDLSRYPTVYDSMGNTCILYVGSYGCTNTICGAYAITTVYCYQSSMAKQAIGNIPSHHVKSDNTTRVMDYVQRPLVTTQIAEMNRFNDFLVVNAMVAVAIYTGFNQEDR